MSAAILKLVFAFEIMPAADDISANIIQTLPNPSSQNVFLLGPSLPVNLLLEDTQKILDKMKLRDSKRVHLYTGGAQNGRFCPCPFHNPSF